MDRSRTSLQALLWFSFILGPLTCRLPDLCRQ
jgi:hypothetical protein